MWLKADLHLHTSADADPATAVEPEDLLARARETGLHLIAITDHDSTARVQGVLDAATASDIQVLPGIELSTDAGHVLLLAPADLALLEELATCLGVRRGCQVEFTELVKTLRRPARDGRTFRSRIIAIGAHVDQSGSLLGPRQTRSADTQVRDAQLLDSLEVVSDATRTAWLSSGGIKGSGVVMPLVRFSDSHLPGEMLDRHTWIYLQDASVAGIRQALATPEASISFEPPSPPPDRVIESIQLVGGMHEGVVFSFHERVNVIIGPPSSGKTLILDALRFAFDAECPIEPILNDARARLGRALGQGCEIIVTGRSEHGPFRLRRRLGASASIDVPFRPIAFSQTELVRRAMEARPSMELLDMHAPEVLGYRTRLENLKDEARDRLQASLVTARQIRPKLEQLSNPVDGLAAARAMLGEVAPSEAIAAKAVEITRIEEWRNSARQEVERWHSILPSPEPPSLPGIPSVATFDATPFLPGEAYDAAKVAFGAESRAAADRLHSALVASLDASQHAFEDLRGDIEAALVRGGLADASEALEKIGAARGRVAALEAMNQEVDALKTGLRTEVCRIADLTQEADNLRTEMRRRRKQACTSVNASMETFFSRIDEEAVTAHMDELVEAMREGTYCRREQVPLLRSSLDRKRLIEVAVLHVAGLPPPEEDPQFIIHDQLARNAMDRGLVTAVATAAVCWPGDGLELNRKGEGTQFQDLTEGLRALAIKEISFAASTTPAISDQPEDAVPSQAVFESLVPAIRRQRGNRQFILVSHDANLVVTGDADHVWVLRPGTAPESGWLDEPAIRDAAMDLLEGGREAFEQRGRRYAGPDRHPPETS